MTANIPDLITKLKDRDTSLGDPLNVPHTTRAHADYWSMKREIAATISALNNLPADLHRAEARLADVVERRDAVVAKQQEIDAVIATFVDTNTIVDGVQRDREIERQWHTLRKRERLLQGSLWKSENETFEPIAFLDQRITELTTARDRVLSALNAAIAQAEALAVATTTS